MTEEMVRDLEQIRHQAETIQRSLPRDQTLSETQTSAVKIVTPIYKSHERTPGSDIQMGGSHAHSERIRSQNGDYTAERSTEQVRMQIIDPRVNSNAHIPSQHGSLPGYGRRTVGDFPSEHGKRSLLNLDPLEQRRIRSIQSRPITTSTYLTESVDRHREMEASKLRNFLKASEDDANKPWNKPAWPGPKGDDDSGESSRQIELIKKKIADLQRRGIPRTQSMGELMLDPHSAVKPETEPPKNAESNWLVKVRTHRYLQNAQNNVPTRARSIADLRSQDPLRSRPFKEVDELSWQVKKEFHLSKYTERRRSSFISESEHQERRSQQDFESHRLSSQKRSGSQLLYPPGSTDHVLSEHTFAPRPQEKVVYENKPYPPSVLAVNISQASTSTQERSRPPYQQRQPEDDFSERLMSPPPGRQTPKSILKQSYTQQQQQFFSDQEQRWEDKREYQRQEMQEQTASSYNHEPDSRRTPLHEPDNRRTPLHYGSNYELDEAERFRIMQENLRKHREQRSYTPQNVPKYPATSFNGPFFKLEEVTPGPAPGDRPRSQSVAPLSNTEQQRRYEEEMRYQYNQSRYQEANRVKQISSSEMELHRHQPDSQDNEGVVIWPPPSTKDRPRPASAMAKSILDPDRIDEFRKQKHLEMEAMRRKDERENYLRQKQMQAIQVQQQRLYEQRQQLISEQPEMHGLPYPMQGHPHQHQIQQQQLVPEIHTISPTEELKGEDAAPVRVFETRPISVMSAGSAPDIRDLTSPSTNTWRRTYVVDKQTDIVAKNEILTSEELLEKERFEVDLLKRREAFIEKPEDEVEIFRVGKRWQPPPEKPYMWPTLRRPVTVDPGMEPVDFSPNAPDSSAEYRWQPVVYDPTFKKEHKNFTPTSSPPHSPRRGHGTGPLDDVAKRQTKYVIQASPDGSHRPKAAFKTARHAPMGGFLPHAPNSIKIVKKRSSQIHNSMVPDAIDQEIQDIEIINERNLQERRMKQDKSSRSRSLGTTAQPKQQQHQVLYDWEKIYDLPPHSSTVTNKDPPPNVDVRKRLQLFETQAMATLQRRAYSENRGSSSQLHSTSATPRLPETASPAFNNPQTANGSTLLRRADSRGESHGQSHSQSHQHRHRHGRSGEHHSRQTSHNETPVQHHVHYPQSSTSSLPPEQHQRPPSVASQRRLQRIIQATQPSPAPASYERARPYLPPPLPPGYKRPPSPQYGHQQISPRSPPPQQPGNTRRLAQMVQHSAQNMAQGLSRHESHRAHPVQSGIHAAEYAPVRSSGGGMHHHQHHSQQQLPPPPPPPTNPPNYYLGPSGMRHSAAPSPAGSRYL